MKVRVYLKNDCVGYDDQFNIESVVYGEDTLTLSLKDKPEQIKFPMQNVMKVHEFYDEEKSE